MKTLCKYTKKYLTIKHIDKKIIVVNVTILMRTLTKKSFSQRGDRILEHKLVHKICRRLLFFLGKRCIRLGRDGDIVGRMPLNTHRKNIISTKVGKGQVSHFRFAKGSGNQTTIQTFSGWLRILRRLKKTYQFPRPPDTKVTIFRNKSKFSN